MQDNLTMEFWEMFLRSQLKRNLPYILEHSIKDFHTPGFNYICFMFSPTLTIRLYIIEPSKPMDTSKINIHNHLYDSQILVLQGSITNNVYRETSDVNMPAYHHYHLTSALHPDNKEKQIKLENLGIVHLQRYGYMVLEPGDTHFQPHDEIHNVYNDVTQKTAFMVWEYPTVKEHSTLYSTKEYGTTLPTPGAYNRFTEAEVTKLLTDLIKEI
jgi:predicted metal-dependent enzyme (double-stranded beta helix superfamily)